MSQKIKAVLFDLDGTLLDTHDLILASFGHAVSEVLGKTFPEKVLMQKVGQPLDVQMWDFTDDPAVHERLLSVYREHNHRIHDQYVHAFPGIAEALAQLKGLGVPMGVVTSKRHALAQRGLDVCGLAEFAACLVGPDDYPAHKPDPGPVRYGCELLGFSSDECVYVGDSPFDMQAGNAAGCTTIAVSWGMFDREVLEAQSPAFMISSADELCPLVRSLL